MTDRQVYLIVWPDFSTSLEMTERKGEVKGKKGKKNIESVPSEAGPDLDGIESECPMSKCRCAGITGR